MFYFHYNGLREYKREMQSSASSLQSRDIIKGYLRKKTREIRRKNKITFMQKNIHAKKVKFTQNQNKSLRKNKIVYPRKDRIETKTR